MAYIFRHCNTENFLELKTAVKSWSKRTRHRILRHCSKENLSNLKWTVKGSKISNKNKLICNTSAQGKMRHCTNKKADRKTNKTLYLIHCDLSGAIQLTSINESKYPIIFLDNYSRLIVVYFLRNKSQAANATEKVLADMAPYSSVKIF